MSESESIRAQNNYDNFVENLPLGIILFDKNYRIEEVNNNLFSFGVLNFTGKEEIIGEIFSKEIFNAGLISADFGEENLPVEIPVKSLQTPQGIYSITLKAVPFYDGGSFNGGIAVIEDHLFKSVEISKNEPDKYISILKCFHNAVTIFDEDGKIIALKTDADFSDFMDESVNSVEKLFIKTELQNAAEKLLRESEGIKSSSVEVVIDGVLFKLTAQKKNGGKNFGILTFDRLSESGINRSKEEINELLKFQYISESIVDSVLGLDESGSIEFWSAGAEKIFGFKRSEVFGKFIGKVIKSIDSNYFKSLTELLDSKGIWESEIRYIDKNESVKFLNLKLTAVNIEGRKSILGIAADITARTEMERELKISEERYRNIVTSSVEFILLLDLDKKITYANPAFIENSGFELEELSGKDFRSVIDEEFLKEKKNLEKELFGSSPHAFEFPLKKKDGAAIFVHANITPHFDLNEEPKYYSVFITDITKIKEAEKDFLLIRSVFEASMDGIAVLQDRKIALANDAFAQMFAFDSLKDSLNTDPVDLCVESDIAKFAGALQSLERNKKKFIRLEFEGKKINDETLFLNTSLTSYSAMGESFIVAIFRDITETKSAEEKLINSEERYRHITSAINDFLWMAERKNGNLTPVFYTSAVERMLGYTSEDFLGKKFLWFRIIHPKDRTMVLNQLRAAYADPARENAELEYRAVNRKGNILWIRNKININRAEDESIISVVGLVSDITLSKRAEEELKRSAEELRTLNESKDRFISIISHDLRTPFSSILGYTDMLLGDRQLPEEKQVEYTLYIQESAKNMLELVNALLDWTRLQTGRIKFETKRLEANVLANKSISMLNGTAMQKNINLVSSIDRQTLIHADESLMLQAFNNLVSNAIKFTKPGGNITISAEQLPEEHLVRFSVKDSGVGIRKEDMDKLFRVDSKFTSPGTAGEKGTGLGLSLVREIVEKHGGKIWVKSKIGHGAEFLFTIPVSSTTIMIVDDILTDRILYTKLIHSIMPEYIIKDAPHGKAAFEAIKSISPLLVITEHKMPLMSGYELVKQVQLSDEINFKPAFIILSRKLNKSIISSYKELGLKYIFSKPVDLDQFRLAINNSLKEALVS